VRAALILLALAGPAAAGQAPLASGEAGGGADFPQVAIGEGKATARLTVGRAELVLTTRPNPELPDDPLPAVELRFDGAPAGTLVSASGSARFPASAGLVEMDAANDTPEVVLQSFSGGAHCCTEVAVLTRTAKGAWAALQAGAFDGDGSFVRDPDKDGRYEVVGPDDAFMGAFGCMACSAAPQRIAAVQGGELRDVTFEPRFQRVQRAYLAEMEQAGAPSAGGNGALAGWVAQKIILGEGAEAWADMLIAYDRSDSWGLRFCPEGAADCTDEAAVTRPFPEVLAEFLHDHGYPL
jgi:hypothetical protein